MKCSGCGAEIPESAKFCEYCGSQISYEMRREQEQINKAGCPKCHSSNVQFNRENQGEVRGKQSKSVIHKTVGFCKDCGYTWYPDTAAGVANGTKKKSNMIWWVLGWIFFFPAPVMVLIWRKKNTWNTKVKIGVTVVFWILFFAIGASGDKSDSKDSNRQVAVSATEEVKGFATIYDDAEIVDLMNGLGTKKIGTISVAHADSVECTEENMLDWYINYVLKNPDCNYHLIIYNDIPNKGVYSMGAGFIQKDVEITSDDRGSYSTGDDAGSTYYLVDENKGTITVQGTMVGSDVIEKVEKKIDNIIPDEYKGSKNYAVEVGGEEGNLDCNITIVNEEFADANYQDIAEGLAKKIKDEDLGIGYFSIAFQSNDYILNATSSLMDLKTEEPAKIETNVFDNKETGLSESEGIDDSSINDLTEDEKMNLFVTMLEASVSSNFGEDNYTIDRDGKTVTLNVWKDGIAVGVALAVQGDEETKAAWKEMKSNVEGMSKNVYNTFDQVKIEDGHICVNVLNDIDKSKVLLTILDGVTVYDVID